MATTSNYHLKQTNKQIYCKFGIFRENFIFENSVKRHMGDFKNNAPISLINVYRLSKADLLLKLILRYVINVFLASCQVSLL